MKKRTRRTHWALLNPLEHAQFQASKLSTAEWNEQIAPVITATEQLMQGNWHPHEVWNKLFYALNRIESMLKLKHAADVFPHVTGRVENGTAQQGQNKPCSPMGAFVRSSHGKH